MSSTATVLRRVLDSCSQFPVKLHNFIDNEFENTPEKLESVNPATGDVFFYLARSKKREGDRAVEAAKTAYRSWSTTSPQYRSSILLKAADIIEQNLDDLALLESRDQGKPVWLAKAVDIPRAVLNLRFFANAILHHTDPSVVHHSPPGVSYVVRDSVGVALLISPWNLPLYLLTFKVAPALATGNTVVCKPSELTSATAYVLMHAFYEAGLPKGVLNMVLGTGSEVGESLVTNPDVALVSFTGSTTIGKRIGTLVAPFNKKTSLEMGGKNACIVCPSADLSTVVPDIARSCFINQGEVCLCTSRLFVHISIFNSFTEKFIEETKNYTVGDPEVASSKLGAVNSKAHFDKVMSYISLAKEEGGQILTGGKAVSVEGRCKNGLFIEPTVITGLSDSTRCVTEEIFGPVVCVLPFDTDDEVVSRANSTSYGLSATIFSSDVSQIHSIAHRLRVGTVWCNTWMLRDLNMPFGGTKESGMGREGGEDSLHFFTEQKTVCIKF